MAASLGLFAAAVGVRALPWRTVVEGDLVLPYGSDALYHLRRALYTAVRFPASLDFDRYIHHPQGARPIWTPVFDWTLGLLLLPLADANDASAFERAAVFVPPLLGGATVVALYLVAHRHFGAGAAALAGIALALLSGHFWYSQIGFVDHHAAVALCAVALLGSGMSFVEGRGGAGRALGFGLAIAAALLVWPGSLLHVALVQAACALEVAAEPERARARALAGRLAGVHVVACLLVLPLALPARWPQWGAFSPLVLDCFQPWWLAAGGAWAAGCAALWRLDCAGRNRRRRGVCAALLALGIAAVSLAALPGLAAGAGDAWRWLARREVFQAQVAESLPLLWYEGRFTLSVATARLSGFVLLFPVAWLFAARAARGRSGAALRVLLVFALTLFAATLLQRRFFDSFSVALALSMGWAGASLWRAWVPIAWRGPRRAAAAAVFTLASVALLAPTLATYAPYLRNECRAARGEALEVSPRRAASRILLETAHWLRVGTPPTAGWLDPEQEPAYGVLGPWHAGHAIEYTGRRPAVVDNFGDDLGPENFARAARYFRSAEPEAAAIAAALGARYVVVGRVFDFGPPAPGPESSFRALSERDGAAGSDGEPAWVRHRLVYESRPVGGSGPDRPSLYRVYELVPGARIRGRAAPGARVELELTVWSNRLRAFAYRSAARADAAGSYRFRVPYAIGGEPGAVRTAPAYRLRCGDAVAEVHVPESAVLSGAELAGPALCDGAGVDARGAL